MARPKEKNVCVKSEVARIVADMCNSTDKSQYQIADEAGLTSGTNIITMFKSGRTKVPYKRIKSLADATGGDAEALLEACLREYNPEILDILTEIKGRVLSNEEKTLVLALRKAKREQDTFSGERTHWNLGDIKEVKKWAESTVKKLTA